MENTARGNRIHIGLYGKVNAGKIINKQIWKQIVERKIQNQSNLLSKLSLGENLLKHYYTNVKSGDTTNREGIAAKQYWRHLFGEKFLRDRMGPCPNNYLNNTVSHGSLIVSYI